MGVREQGAKARLCVLHFEEELFATAGATKHGYDALNMRNVFRKIPRREGDVAEEVSGEVTSKRNLFQFHKTYGIGTKHVWMSLLCL